MCMKADESARVPGLSRNCEKECRATPDARVSRVCCTARRRRSGEGSKTRFAYCTLPCGQRVVADQFPGRPAAYQRALWPPEEEFLRALTVGCGFLLAVSGGFLSAISRR